MPAGRGSHLAVSQKALLHDPKLGGIAPVPPAGSVRGRQDFDLGFELTVGHKVGRITGIEIPSDGPRRRDTLVAAMRKLLHAVYSVAKNRKPFVFQPEQARAA